MGCGASSAGLEVPVLQHQHSTKPEAPLCFSRAPSASYRSRRVNTPVKQTSKTSMGTQTMPEERPISLLKNNSTMPPVPKDSEDEFDVKSTVGDNPSRDISIEALSNEEKALPNLATFCNNPQECFYCKSAAVTHVCEVCEDFFFCERCMFNAQCDHDPMHPISAIHEIQLNHSRSLGSSVGTFDGAASSFFYDPCDSCNRVIIDTELVFHCEKCGIFICDSCFNKNGSSVHEHKLKTFQRAVRTSAADSTLVSKTRTTEGNKVINDYVVVKLLGRGSYAKVNLVQHHRERKLYALKILRRNRISKAKRALSSKSTYEDDDLLREIAVMKFVSHPNIVQLKEVIDDVEAHKVYVIMEYCEKGPVHIYGDPPLLLPKIHKYGREIMVGLLHLHGEYLFHRDIKPANCLVDALDVVKIADFGTCSSRMKNSNIDGTPAYACPEQFRGMRVAGDVVDSWSFAMTLYQMSHGSLPFRTETFGDLRSSLLDDRPISISPNIDPGLAAVLSQMLEKDLVKRMLLRDAMRHPFFCLGSVERPICVPPSDDSLSDQSQKDIYTRAQMTVLRGKRVGEYFHGMRSMRKMQRKALKCSNLIDDCLDLMEGSGGLVVPSARAAESHSIGVNEDEVNQVVSMILETQKNGELELENLQMNEPPPFLVDAAPRTTTLRFVNNKLTSVSSLDFSRFEVLRVLTIVNNKLRKLPVQLLLAPRLQHLDLSHNHIEEIPPAISSAKLLEVLSLNYNLIRHIGCDGSGRSVFSNRCLRKVMLGGNPLVHIPEALETCPRLELTMDDSPVLMEEWASSLQERDRVTVMWNEIYPRQVHAQVPLLVAVKNIRLYNPVILDTINAKNIALSQVERWLPIGEASAEEIRRMTSEDAQAAPLQSLGKGNETCPSVQPIRSTIPLLKSSAARFLKSRFVWARLPDDAKGGYLRFKDYLQGCVRRGERTVVFVEEKKLKGTVREMVIAALCETVRECSEESLSFGECYQMVIDALRGLYD